MLVSLHYSIDRGGAYRKKFLTNCGQKLSVRLFIKRKPFCYRLLQILRTHKIALAPQPSKRIFKQRILILPSGSGFLPLSPLSSSDTTIELSAQQSNSALAMVAVKYLQASKDFCFHPPIPVQISQPQCSPIFYFLHKSSSLHRFGNKIYESSITYLLNLPSVTFNLRQFGQFALRHRISAGPHNRDRDSFLLREIRQCKRRRG